MIKVCMVGVFYYFSDARVKGYAESLQRAGNMVDILGLHGLKTNEVVDESGVRIYSIPARQSRKSRIRYLLEYGFSFLLLSFLLTKLYFKNRYDVIHVHNMPDFLVFSGLIPKLFGAKIILDVHDPMPEVYLSKFPAEKGGFALWLMRMEEKISVRFADAVITANSHFKENLIGRGAPASKITTINNFPDPEVFNHSKRLAGKKKSRERFTLIFPGTIAARYGLEVAIKALPLLKDGIPNIHLLIIGRQLEYLKSLVSLAEELDVSSFVEFKPSIPNREVPQQLTQADIGIYPALPDCHMSIATPGKLLEFAIMGLPIISSRLRIVEEMFDDSAVMFFEPGNVRQFAQCVLSLYDSPVLRKELIYQTDQILAQKFSWEREIQTYFNLLRHLILEKSSFNELQI